MAYVVAINIFEEVANECISVDYIFIYIYTCIYLPHLARSILYAIRLNLAFTAIALIVNPHTCTCSSAEHLK